MGILANQQNNHGGPKGTNDMMQLESVAPILAHSMYLIKINSFPYSLIILNRFRFV